MNLNSLQEANYKQKSLFLISIFVFISFILFYLLIKPTIGDVKKIRLEILAQKIEIAKNINKEKNKSELGAKLKKIEPELEQFNKIFVNKNRDLEFITTLEGVADKNNLKQVITLNTDLFDSKKSYSIIPVTLNTTGEFENITQYLGALESLTYYMRIKSFSLGKSESSDSENLINLNLTIDTYWR